MVFKNHASNSENHRTHIFTLDRAYLGIKHNALHLARKFARILILLQKLPLLHVPLNIKWNVINYYLRYVVCLRELRKYEVHRRKIFRDCWQQWFRDFE